MFPSPLRRTCMYISRYSIFNSSVMNQRNRYIRMICPYISYTRTTWNQSRYSPQTRCKFHSNSFSVTKKAKH